MKCYAITRNGQERCIKKVSERNDKYVVYFADGTRFLIDINEENYNKLYDALEEQAEEGISRLPSLRKRKSLSGFMTAGALVGIPAACYGISSIPAVHDLLSSQDPMKIVIGAGIVTVLGTIPLFTKFVKDKAMVAEAEKLDYRNNHFSVLEGAQEYPNAFNGLSNKTRRFFEEEEYPMSIFQIDNYTKEDLEKIVSNIIKEESFEFYYSQPEPEQASKK